MLHVRETPAVLREGFVGDLKFWQVLKELSIASQNSAEAFPTRSNTK